MRYDWLKFGHITGSLWEGKLKQQKKKLFNLEFMFYIFQAIFFKFFKSNINTITKNVTQDYKNLV